MNFPTLARLLVQALIVVTIGVRGSSGWSNDRTAELLTTGGSQLDSRLLQIDAQGQPIFRAADRKQTLAVDQLVRFGNPREQISDPLLVTSDGSLWVARQTFAPIAIEDEHVSFDSDTFGTIRLPMAQLRGILFLQPENDRLRDRMLDDILHGQQKNDLVMLENGDKLTGLVLTLQDDQLIFQTAAAKSTIALDQVVALVLNPTLARQPRQPDQFLLVGTHDGSRLVVESLKPAGRGVVMKTVAGLVVEAPLADIGYLQRVGGQAIYLSDIPIARYHHQPYLSLDWPYQRDRNVQGGRLRCGGQVYEKGIGVHSIAGLTYRLDRPYRQLQAELGIDDATEGAGSIILRIYTDDGSGQWEPKFTSPIIRGGQPPTPIAVDIRGAKRLSLIVDVADRGDQQDHANLLDARLIP
ncbi:MAG: hypothetical protein GTO53_05515 [Planctomycetales bacterium]|nr:hypothetical protein [Planctomycetales bacterium]NIM08606.1 hypothetical protein [Planctomycetales bacterium]NIN08074.1 hypothetical protein [Planctomycetales bacterium]NIN77208.1 hypothetical protein [Planctomycetales bacterium]NIO34390.1 hypothetical protein [Planctomycetales bacterium]